MKIRFTLLVVVILTVATNNTLAQRFTPGLIAGFVATDLAGVDPYDEDFHKASFSGGGLISTKLSDDNSVQFEILYIQKGSLQPADSINNYTFYKLSLNYVEVPLMLKHNLHFNINKKPVDRFYFEIGPSFGRLVSFKQNINGTLFNEGNFSKNEFALNLGVGCTIVNNLYFNIRYTNSIFPVVDNSKQLNSFFWYTFNKGNNMVFAFTLRYIWGSSQATKASN